MQSIEERYRASKAPIIVSISGNLALFLIKVIVGLSIGSVSMVSDAFHSFSDMGTTIVVLLGMKSGMKGPDAEHPYGHARSEHIAALVVSFILAIVGFEVIMVAFGELLNNTATLRPSVFAIVVVVITIALKEAMARYTLWYSDVLDSEALEADAWHHRSDALSSIGVLVSLVAGMYGYTYLDVMTGLLIGAVVLYTGYSIGMKAVKRLLGRGPTDEEMRIIEDIVHSYPELSNPHRIAVHDYGYGRCEVVLHVKVRPDMTIREAHRLATNVESEILSRLGAHATVHVEPIHSEGTNTV